jgi:protein SCO1
VAFSINPNETPSDALKKLDDCTLNYSGKRGGPGWHFLTGNTRAIDAVTNAIGFHYRYDTQNKIFVHAAGMMILTPQGRVSRYLFGVTFQPRDLHEGLLASSHSAIGRVSDVARLLCYPFSAGSARYNRLVIRALQCTAAAMLIALICGLVFLWRADLRTPFRSSTSRGGP